MAVPEHSVHYLEFVTPDVEAVCALYESTHGWQFRPTGPELGNAFTAALPDGSICGVRAPMHEQEKTVVRAYVRVPDVAAAVRSAAEAGAQIALESMEIPGHGTIAIFFHGGIEHGVWQLP